MGTKYSTDHEWIELKEEYEVVIGKQILPRNS